MLTHFSVPCPAAYDRWRNLVHAAILLMLAIFVSAPVSAKDALVVAFGDSLMAGYQLDPGEGFAPQLEKALKADGVAARVVNAGVSGDTSAGGRQRIAWTLDNLNAKPDLVIVELGANDMLRGLPPKQTLRNLNAIIKEVQRRKIPVLLAGMLATPNIGEEDFRYFNAIYPFLAKRHDIPLYPFFLKGVALRRELLLGDVMHPNPKGVQVIVNGILPDVKAALE